MSIIIEMPEGQSPFLGEAAQIRNSDGQLIEGVTKAVINLERDHIATVDLTVRMSSASKLQGLMATIGADTLLKPNPYPPFVARWLARFRLWRVRRQYAKRFR